MNADDFFFSVLPRAIAADIEAYVLLEGDIAIAVRGKGEWTVHLGDLEEPVTRDFARDAALRLVFVPSAFQRFLDGTLNVQTALAKRHLTVQGDAQLMEKLGFFLTKGTPAHLWPPPSPNP